MEVRQGQGLILAQLNLSGHIAIEAKNISPKTRFLAIVNVVIAQVLDALKVLQIESVINSQPAAFLCTKLLGKSSLHTCVKLKIIPKGLSVAHKELTLPQELIRHFTGALNQ